MIYMTDGYQAHAAVFGQPLTHARILWNNVLAGGTFSADHEVEGFEAARAQAPDPYSWWRPGEAGALTVALDDPAQIDCIALAAHTLGSEGRELTIETWDGSAWVEAIDPFVPASDAPIMVAVAAVETDGIRLSIDGDARIGTVSAGRLLEMPRPGYTSLPPLALVRSTTYETNRSMTGLWLGRSIMAVARPFDATWQHLPEAWVRSMLDPFIRRAREVPFFVALRPAGYPEDVGYVMTTADIVPERMGITSLMSVAVQGDALVGPAE